MISHIQAGASRKFHFDGKPHDGRAAVDLLIADYPDGLRVPGVSDPPTQIPPWNENTDSFLKVAMGFAYTYLHDDGAFLLFYPDSPLVRREVASYFKNYRMQVLDEWTIINYLHLANPINPSKNVSSPSTCTSVYPSSYSKNLSCSHSLTSL